jgi:hypothetical protein
MTNKWTWVRLWDSTFYFTIEQEKPNVEQRTGAMYCGIRLKRHDWRHAQKLCIVCRRHDGFIKCTLPKEYETSANILHTVIIASAWRCPCVTRVTRNRKRMQTWTHGSKHVPRFFFLRCYLARLVMEWWICVRLKHWSCNSFNSEYMQCRGATSYWIVECNHSVANEWTPLSLFLHPMRKPIAYGSEYAMAANECI